ncbi:MAG: DUF2993 domain-containing protein [Firmicutes bacterium]|nr:DUF2993 domain-containing protein [Bacillota bacterium]
MKRLIAGFLITLLVFLMLCEFTLPGLAAGALAREVERSELHPGRVEARVFAFPAAKILLGRVDGARLEMEAVDLKGCRASLLAVDIPRGTLDWRGVREGALPVAFQPAGPVRVRLVIGEKDLNEYLARSGLRGIENPRLDFGPRGVRLEGKVGFLGSSLTVSIWGSFRSDSDGRVEFFPTELQVEGETLSPELAQKFLPHLRFNLTGAELPFSFKVRQVNITGENLILSGQI